MALFKNAATEWEKTMTENDLDQMEAQGLDVSKYREKLAARRAKEAEEAEVKKEGRTLETLRFSDNRYVELLDGEVQYVRIY